MKYFYKLILKVLGWKAVDPPAPEPKCIILGVPHTSAWDFVISFLYYRSMGATAYVLVKKSFFKWPLGRIMKAMGAVPVDKTRGASLVRAVLEEFKNREYFHLAIAPEGTRKRVEKWKSGFHTIAKSAGVPVYLGYFDWGKKEVSRGEKIELTDDVEADMKRIRQWYKDKGVQGKFPKLFTPGSDLK